MPCNRQQGNAMRYWGLPGMGEQQVESADWRPELQGIVAGHMIGAYGHRPISGCNCQILSAKLHVWVLSAWQCLHVRWHPVRGCMPNGSVHGFASLQAFAAPLMHACVQQLSCTLPQLMCWGFRLFSLQ